MTTTPPETPSPATPVIIPASTEVQEIWFKSKRVLRTVVQTGIPTFVAFAGVLPTVLDALGLPVNSKVYLWLLAFAAVITAVAGALTRVMAIPAVNSFLLYLGLSSVPKAAVADGKHEAGPAPTGL